VPGLGIGLDDEAETLTAGRGGGVITIPGLTSDSYESESPGEDIILRRPLDDAKPDEEELRLRSALGRSFCEREYTWLGACRRGGGARGWNEAGVSARRGR
jgi:hypothetical protein